MKPLFEKYFKHISKNIKKWKLMKSDENLCFHQISSDFISFHFFSIFWYFWYFFTIQNISVFLETIFEPFVKAMCCWLLQKPRENWMHFVKAKCVSKTEICCVSLDPKPMYTWIHCGGSQKCFDDKWVPWQKGYYIHLLFDEPFKNLNKLHTFEGLPIKHP
jgi:hypothetical protein